jgi:hypothetical protein
VNGPPPGNQTCLLGGWRVARATLETVATLRRQPGPAPGRPLPANLLNHAGDQAVLGVSTVLHAAADLGLPTGSFQDWGVVGAARFPGRVTIDAAVEKFGRMGPLCVSPVLIPYYSQHALPSLVTLALRSHGPAMGVGGGYDGFVQALLTALTLQQEEGLPGVWVVLTAWDPEPFSEPEAADATPPVCRAVALTLRPAAAGARGGACLRLVPAADDCPAGSLTDLFRCLEGAAGTWRCALPGGSALELTAGAMPLAKSA